MANENETVMDVCAEWRDCIESADPSVWNDARIAGLVKTTKAQQIAYLDRIVAAWKREKSEIESDALAVGGIVEAERHKPGNAAAMREALEMILDKVNGLDEECGVDPVEIRDLARAALSAPARQCDVGTADEQSERFTKYCKMFPRCRGCECCGKVLLGRCELAWAQMPYAAEEGGAE